MASTLAYSPVVSPHPTSSSMNQEHTLPTPAPEASASVKMHEMSLNDAPIATTPVLESVRLCKSTASFAASLHAPPDVITVASLPDTSMNDAENARKHIPSMPAFIKNFFMQERPESLLSTSHNAVADWCKMGLSKDIYKVVIQGLKDVVDTYGRQLNAAATIEPNMEFLSEILINWEHFTYRLARINYLFDRINSPYMIQHTSFTSVSDAGKHFYRERITSNLKITSCVVNSTVALLLQKRRAIIIDDDILKKMLCFIHDDFNAFIRPFQRIFSQQIRRYYKINAERAVIQLPIDQYLAFSYKQILRERAMCSELGRFVADIHPSPDHIAAQMYLFDHVQVIFQGFDSISRDAQLAVGLYKFALQFDEITMLQQMFADRVKQKFKGLMKFEPIQDYRQMVDDCIERVRGMYNLKLQLQMVVSSIFENDRQFVSTLNDALESVINQQSSRIASLLASFMDYTLNDLKVQPQLINKESEYHFIPALEIFRHLEAKDVFKVQFKHILVKQLIWTLW
ncbi:Cullin repeat-like-containing domain protein [Gongronella butleri]|nr:Cullin repeat-like-containing domain protein [Gongronella butleri]